MKFLRVYGYDDFAALQFEKEFNQKDVLKDMIKRNMNKLSLITDDDDEIYVEIIELKTPEEVFNYMRNCIDEDDLKHENYYQIEEEVK